MKSLSFIYYLFKLIVLLFIYFFNIDVPFTNGMFSINKTSFDFLYTNKIINDKGMMNSISF